MSLCVLDGEPTENGWRHVCRECEAVYETPFQIHHATCRKPRGRCKFLGEELKRVPCQTCKAKAQITVFACEIWEQCTVQTSVGLPVCSICKDHQNG